MLERKENCLRCRYYAKNDIQDWCLLHDFELHEYYKHNHCPDYDEYW